MIMTIMTMTMIMMMMTTTTTISSAVIQMTYIEGTQFESQQQHYLD